MCTITLDCAHSAALYLSLHLPTAQTGGLANAAIAIQKGIVVHSKHALATLSNVAATVSDKVVDITESVAEKVVDATETGYKAIGSAAHSAVHVLSSVPSTVMGFVRDVSVCTSAVLLSSCSLESLIDRVALLSCVNLSQNV